MTTVYLSLAAVVLMAAALGVYAWRRPAPAPAPATEIAAGYTLAELAELRGRFWAHRTPLAALEAPTLEDWPPDEAAELLAAWRDEAAS